MNAVTPSAILREVFGDPSSDEDGELFSDEDGESFSDEDGESLDDQRERVGVDNRIDAIVPQQWRRHSTFEEDTRDWEPIPDINGLWICRDFLSADEQSGLLSALEKEGYLAEDSPNQAMRFGDLPSWALELSCCIREDIVMSHCFSESMDQVTSDDGKEACLFPEELLWRKPLFNQFILNTYQPGEGICAHVDLLRFEDGIAIVSLESPCVMHFSPVEAEEAANPAKIPVLLSSGSVVLMWGEARYQWKHEINRNPGFQVWEGQEIEQQRRVSVTLRKLCVEE